MIDSEFITRYTNGLYTTPPEHAPRYDEFRDMFSSGQIKSKEWLVSTLKQVVDLNTHKCTLVGAWYGTLGFMLKDTFPGLDLTMLDIDSRCKYFVDNIMYDTTQTQYITADMHSYDYNTDIVINTSCEHINNTQQWLQLLPSRTTVVLQSNNFVAGRGHINCVDSVHDFQAQAGLTEILYAGELVMPVYTRYMIIGRT